MVQKSSLIFAATLALFSTFEPAYGLGVARGKAKHDVQKPRFMKKNVKRYYGNTTTTDVGAGPGRFGDHSPEDPNPEHHPINVPGIHEDSSTTYSTTSTSTTDTSSTTSVSSTSSSAQQGQQAQPPPSTTSPTPLKPTTDLSVNSILGGHQDKGVATSKEKEKAASSASSTTSLSRPSPSEPSDGSPGSKVEKESKKDSPDLSVIGKATSSEKLSEGSPHTISSGGNNQDGQGINLPTDPVISKGVENDDNKSTSSSSSPLGIGSPSRQGQQGNGRPTNTQVENSVVGQPTPDSSSSSKGGRVQPTTVAGGVWDDAQEAVNPPTTKEQPLSSNLFGGDKGSDKSAPSSSPAPGGESGVVDGKLPTVTAKPEDTNKQSNVQPVSVASGGLLVPSSKASGGNIDNDELSQKSKDVVNGSMKNIDAMAASINSNGFVLSSPQKTVDNVETTISTANIPASITNNVVIVPNPKKSIDDSIKDVGSATKIPTSVTSNGVIIANPEKSIIDNNLKNVGSATKIPTSITSNGVSIANPEKSIDDSVKNTGSAAEVPITITSNGVAVPNPQKTVDNKKSIVSATDTPVSITSNGIIVPNPQKAVDNEKTKISVTGIPVSITSNGVVVPNPQKAVDNEKTIISATDIPVSITNNGVVMPSSQKAVDNEKTVISAADVPASITSSGAVVPSPQASKPVSILSNGFFVPNASEEDSSHGEKPTGAIKGGVEHAVTPAVVPASITSDGKLVSNPEATKTTEAGEVTQGQMEVQPNSSLGAGQLSSAIAGGISPSQFSSDGRSININPTADLKEENAVVPASTTLENGSVVPHPVLTATSLAAGKKDEGEGTEQNVGAALSTTLPNGSAVPLQSQLPGSEDINSTTGGLPVLPMQTGKTEGVPSITLPNGSAVPLQSQLPGTEENNSTTKSLPVLPVQKGTAEGVSSITLPNGSVIPSQSQAPGSEENNSTLDGLPIIPGQKEKVEGVPSTTLPNGLAVPLQSQVTGFEQNNNTTGVLPIIPSQKEEFEGAPSTTLPNGSIVPLQSQLTGSEKDNGRTDGLPVIPGQKETVQGAPSNTLPQGSVVPLQSQFVGPEENNGTTEGLPVVPVQKGKAEPSQTPLILPGAASTTLSNGEVVPFSSASFEQVKPGEFFDKQQSQGQVSVPAGVSRQPNAGNEQQAHKTGSPASQPPESVPAVGGQVPAGASNTAAQPTVAGSGVSPNQVPPVSEERPGPTKGPVAKEKQAYPSDGKGPFSQSPTGFDQNTVLPVESSITFEASSAPPATGTESAPTGLPSNVPLVLYPSGPKAKQPSNTLLIQIGFLFPLNFDFVWTHDQSQRQIFTYLPLGISYCLGIERLNVTMQTLRAWDTTQDLHYITTLALAWIPSHLVDPLGLAVQQPAGKFYNHPDLSIRTLLGMVNNAVPIRADSTDESGTQTGTSPSDTASTTGAAPVGGNIGKSSPVNTSSVGISVGVVCGAAAYGAAMFFVARRYKKRRQNHMRSSSMYSSPVMSHAGGDTGAGQALMSGAVGGERSVSPYYDRAESRGSARSGGSSGRQQISAPVMAENSLGWN